MTTPAKVCAEELAVSISTRSGTIHAPGGDEAGFSGDDQQLRILAEGTHIPLWATNPRGCVEFVNSAYREFFGTTLEKVQQDGWQPLVHPDSAPDCVSAFLSALQNQLPFYWVTRVRRFDGEWRWVESHGRPWFSASGEFLGMVGSCTDITDRKLAELDLATARRQLNADLERMTRLYKGNTRSLPQDDLSGLLREVIEVAITVTGANLGMIQLFDAVSSTLTLASQVGLTVPAVDFFKSVRSDQSAWGAASARRERVVIEDVGESPFCQDESVRRVLFDDKVQALQTTPLISRTGRLIGTFTTGYRTNQRPGERDQRLLDSLARQAADIIEGAQASIDWREAETRFQFAADHPTVLIWMSGPDKMCNWFNQPWLDYTGRTMEQESGNGWLENVHPDDAQQCLATYVRAFDAREEFCIEYRLKRHDGEYRWQLDHGVPRFNHGQFDGYIGSCFDITERKQSEKSLELFRALVERSLDSFEVIDAATARFVDANAMAYEKLGYTREEFLQLSVPDIAPHIDRETYDRNIARVRAVGSLTFEDIHQRKDGSTFPVEITLSTIVLDRPYVLAIGRDITERKQAESAQRQLTRRLVEVQEQERVRFSRELHDQIGQEVTALQLQLQALKRDCELSAPAGRRLGGLATLAKKLARHVHQIAWELRPAVLDDLGLDKALRRHATNWREQPGLPLDYESSGLRTGKCADPMVEITLYRIAQECLHNVWKHAGARHVSMLLQHRAGELRLIVEDDGRGFDGQAPLNPDSKRSRLGLAGMRERVALVGGTLSVESQPGKGTSICASVPLIANTPIH